ncbi:MAG TPA: hypothetical protein PLW70_07290 [Bacteroidales bacterium]|jgi:dTDP-glucose pyrophosphorylase|nr:hypothetical protein [Bacteroidales bacterium]
MTPQERIKKILDGIDETIVVAKNIAINEIYGLSKARIFNDGEDKNMSKIGTYSNSYKKIREKKGLQTAFVDLTNTTSLMQSVVRDDDSIFFKNDYGKKISKYNEQHFKKRIFAPTTGEKKVWQRILNEEISKLWK